MANINLAAATLFHSFTLLFAAALLPALGESCSCLSGITVYGHISTLAPVYDSARVVAYLICVTTVGTVDRVSRSAVDGRDGSFSITASEAQLSHVNLNQSTIPCAVDVPLSFADGFLGSGLRRCEYEDCRGGTRVIRCVADRFGNVLYPCDE